MTGMIKIRIYRFVLLLLCYLFFGSFLLFGQSNVFLGDSVKYSGLLSYECYWDSVEFSRHTHALSKELGIIFINGQGLYGGIEVSNGYLRFGSMVSLLSGFSDDRRYRIDLGLGVRYRDDRDKGLIFGFLPCVSYVSYEGFSRNNFRLLLEFGFHYRYRSLRASFVRHHYGVLRKRLESYCGPDKLLRGIVLDVRERRELSKTEGGIRIVGSFFRDVLSFDKLSSNFFEFRLGVLF
jgi:hypothetical protein